MALISVSGACSRAGKTTLAVTLLRAVPGAAAVKFTTTEDVFKRCPRGAPCVVCDIDVPFRIVEQDAVLREAGTDTARLAEAGASRVVWAISRASAVPAAWDAVRRRLPDGVNIIMEGSTIVELARPDLHFFVLHPFLSPERWKPTSASLIASCDAVVVNRAATEARPPVAAVLARARKDRGRDDLRVADVSAPLVTWAPDLAARLDAVAAAVAR